MAINLHNVPTAEMEEVLLQRGFRVVFWGKDVADRYIHRDVECKVLTDEQKDNAIQGLLDLSWNGSDTVQGMLDIIPQQADQVIRNAWVSEKSRIIEEIMNENLYGRK